MSPAQVLLRLRQRGVTLSVKGENLAYQAHRGALSAELKGALVEHKPIIIPYLVRSPMRALVSAAVPVETPAAVEDACAKLANVSGMAIIPVISTEGATKKITSLNIGTVTATFRFSVAKVGVPVSLKILLENGAFKVGHGLKETAAILWRDYGVEINNPCDLKLGSVLLSGHLGDDSQHSLGAPEFEPLA